jgi:acetyl esterase
MNDTLPDAEPNLHPEIAEMVRQSRAAPPRPHGREAGELRRRKAERMASLGPGPEIAAVRDVLIQAGEVAIPARVYVPQGPVDAAMVYCHGGGWVTGTLDDYDVLCRALAMRAARWS